MQRMSSTSRQAVMVVLLVSFSAGAVRAQEDGTKSALRGAYTATQADTGQELYRSNCTACHTTSILSGQTFQMNWGGRSAFDLVDRLKTTMPLDNPGKLRQEEYVAIVAYLLRINGYPAGDDALPADREHLKRVRIDAKADAAP
jgi:mono/diheme cytochrome c family protein